MVHEFESIAFVDPARTAHCLAQPDRSDSFQQERQRFSSAEAVNGGTDTHPAQRLLKHFPEYRKAAFGAILATQVGLSKIRADCPHFAEWLGRLESL